MAVFGEVRSLINVAYTSFDRDAYGGKLLRMTYIKQHSVMTVEPKVAVSDGRLNVDQQTCQASPKHTTHKVSLASSFDNFCRLSRRLRDNLSKHSKDHWKKDSPHMQNLKIVGMNLDKKQVQCEVDSARYQIISTKNTDNRMKASAETEWGPTILYDYICRTSYLYTSVVDAMKLEHNNIIAKPQVTGLPATFKPQNSISTKTSAVPYLVESCGTSISYVYERSVSAEMAEILYLPSYDDTGDYKICEESWFIEAVPHLQHAMIHIKSRIPKSKTH